MDLRQRPEPNHLRDQVATFLERDIAAGKFKVFLPSERKLAEQMDVSRLTIRAALKKLESDRVVELTGKRRRVLPSNGKRPAATAECREIVIVSAEPLEEVYHSHVLIFEMLREKLGRHGFGLSIDVSPRFGMTRKGRVLEEKVAQHPDACWLLIRIPPAGQRWFAEHQLNAMVLGTPEAGVDLVSMDLDHDATCFHAASVLAAHGKKRIALVRRAANLIGDERSEAGMRRACEKSKVAPLVYRLAGDSTSVIDWLEAMQRQKRMPDGIIACDPAIFLSVFSFCYRQKLRIPEEVAVICRNDDQLLDAIRPSVARYRVNDSVILNRLWRILLPILRGQVYAKVPTLLMPDFVTGVSSGAPRFP